MPGLELVPLETSEADAYWRAFVAGRTDLETASPFVHLERYLSLPPEEQRTYFAYKEAGRIVGTVRLGGSAPGEPSNRISFFSLLPDARGWMRDAILAAAEPLIAAGADRIAASYDETYSEVFRKLGFEETFSRMRMEASLVRRDQPDTPMVHPEATDVDDITTFLRGVYEGHIDQQFGMHTGTPEEWQTYVTGIWKGESGTYLPLASWLVRDEKGLAGASLATLWMGSPLLVEIGVRKDRRRRGSARTLLTATMNSLVELGHDRLALYTTVGNDPAVKLYEGLGFRQVGTRTLSATLEL